ncbi:PRC-barrel domain-containing protein [Aestuariimicrobium kwangyangense]|uniref:PRC-barrel domain-containing protein n=1 Tax=Aestuariimicrobium kwangyangense TaxID=396389 RepID=UPI0003B76E94|nr:hypothetical protein [Aestuariimicrobium kwangyangense]
MNLNDLLGRHVFNDAGERLGTVVDARFRFLPPSVGGPEEAELVGLVVSPHSRSTFGGFQRSNANAPWMVNAWMRWRHRGSFLVDWAQVARVEGNRLVLRPDFERLDATLRPSSR